MNNGLFNCIEYIFYIRAKFIIMVPNPNEYELYLNRSKNKIYVHKIRPGFGLHYGVVTNRKRQVKKVFDNDSGSEFVEINGEIVLQKSPTNSYQVTATVFTHSDSSKGLSLMEFVIQKFHKTPENTKVPIRYSSFSFTPKQFSELINLLNNLQFIDYSNPENFKIDVKTLPNRPIKFNFEQPDENKISVDSNIRELISELASKSENERLPFLELLKNKFLTKEDFDILSGRKDGLETFKLNLLNSNWDEPKWQEFFKNNSWIFGYGLDYQFLSILQKEAHVSKSGISGKGQVITDFLLTTNNFTAIVELKRPDTPLFKNPNRSESWQLSNDLINAVSQILAQKAEWELKAQSGQNFDSNKNLITQTTIDPKTFLVIGHTSQFSGPNQDHLIMRKTFEMFRRNLRNIEIITFDELLERAKFIVSDKSV
jgi:hypothetical protein